MSENKFEYKTVKIKENVDEVNTLYSEGWIPMFSTTPSVSSAHNSRVGAMLFTIKRRIKKQD